MELTCLLRHLNNLKKFLKFKQGRVFQQIKNHCQRVPRFIKCASKHLSIQCVQNPRLVCANYGEGHTLVIEVVQWQRKLKIQGRKNEGNLLTPTIKIELRKLQSILLGAK